MNKPNPFDKFHACYIVNNSKDRDALRVLLYKTGIRNYNSYREFKEAFFSYDKLYNVQFPDFVICEWMDNTFYNTVLMEMYKKSDFSKSPLLILKDKNQSELKRKARTLDLPVSGFIAKPVSLEALQAALIKALSEKYKF